jgi:hypothetical protein
MKILSFALLFFLEFLVQACINVESGNLRTHEIFFAFLIF